MKQFGDGSASGRRIRSSSRPRATSRARPAWCTATTRRSRTPRSPSRSTTSWSSASSSADRPQPHARCRRNDLLFGLTIFNDFSARDIQGREMGMGMGPQKCKDFAFGIGPWITTIDELPRRSTSSRSRARQRRGVGDRRSTEGMIYSRRRAHRVRLDRRRAAARRHHRLGHRRQRLGARARPPPAARRRRRARGRGRRDAAQPLHRADRAVPVVAASSADPFERPELSGDMSRSRARRPLRTSSRSNRAALPPVRRIVTGHDEDGRSIIVSDGPAPHRSAPAGDARSSSRASCGPRTARRPRNAGNEDTAPAGTVSRRSAPPASGTILRIADFPPDSALRRRRHRAAVPRDRRRRRHAGGRHGERRAAPLLVPQDADARLRDRPRRRDLGAARRGRDAAAHRATCSSSAGRTTPGRTAATGRAAWRSSSSTRCTRRRDAPPIITCALTGGYHDKATHPSAPRAARRDRRAGHPGVGGRRRGAARPRARPRRAQHDRQGDLPRDPRAAVRARPTRSCSSRPAAALPDLERAAQHGAAEPRDVLAEHGLRPVLHA